MSAKYVIGKCETMCPLDEIKMREREKLLHLLEMVPGTEKRNPSADPNRVVKMYNRSAAGKVLTNENNLRPPEVLLKTVRYLLTNVVEDHRYSWLTKYDFIADRLRAVRQDMIIQNIPQKNAITLLEPMVRFHAYSAYWLCDQDIYHFDPHLNKKTLQECLNWLLILYGEVANLESEFDQRYIRHITQSRGFFEAMNLVLNLGNEEILLRLLCLPKKWRTHFLRTATTIGIHIASKNFVKLFRMIQDLNPLLRGLCILQLPILRRSAFQIMSTAYSSKNLKFSLDELKPLLMYESINDLIDDCQHYGLNVNGDYVQFDKNSFKDSEEMVSPKKVASLDEYFNNMDGNIFLSLDPKPDLADRMAMLNMT